MSETINRTIYAMTEYYSGEPQRIAHFLKAHSFARLIGESEGLDERSLLTVELAALVHDIGIKVCEEKYGSTDGSFQEIEGPEPAGALLRPIVSDEAVIERVKHLVACHHTFDRVEGLDHRILLEACFIVNAQEEQFSQAEILSGRKNIFRTKSGVSLLNQCFGLSAIFPLPQNNRSLIEKFFTDKTDSCTCAYFDGTGGSAYVDDLSAPSACAVRMGEYIYIEGSSEAVSFYRDAFELARQNRLTIITLNKKIRSLAQSIYGTQCKKTVRYQMSNKPDISKKTLSENIAVLPNDFNLVRIDEELYHQSLENDWSQYFVKNYRDYRDFEKNGRGYAIVYNGRVVCGASSYSTCRDGYEVVIATHPAFRRKGLAMICASRFILACFKHNRLPHWDCANEQSFALSRKLGYTLVREYNGLKLI